MLLWDLLVAAVWLMLPVYMANNCATLFGGGPPLDGGRAFFDGRRILGDHKTAGGFVLGTAGGVITGAIQAVAAPYILPYVAIPAVPFIVVIAMSLGALTGDAVKSFFKRRLDIDSGAMLPVADQLDFIAGALLFGFITAPAWFIANFTLPLIALVVLMTFPLQLFHNMVAVALGKKKVLW